MMWIDRLTSSPTTNALALTAQFAAARNAVLAENVANIDTPDYHSQELDPQAFQQALGAALQEAKSGGGKRLILRGDAQYSTTRDGRLQATPTRAAAPNVLFHDGRNASLEQLMSQVQENALLYEMAAQLLDKRFDGMLTAIRGRVQ